MLWKSPFLRCSSAAAAASSSSANNKVSSPSSWGIFGSPQPNHESGGKGSSVGAAAAAAASSSQTCCRLVSSPEALCSVDQRTPDVIPQPPSPRSVSSSTATNQAVETELLPLSATATAKPHPVAAPLMIEGDEFYVGSDGICRTLYKLKESIVAKDGRGGGVGSSFMLEERYDIKRATKDFILRADRPWNPRVGGNVLSESGGAAEPVAVLSRNARGMVQLGSPVADLHIQEIDQGVFGSAGTGATTWEASIAMALHLASRPELLHRDATSGEGSDVLELGSGVGLGGMLTKLSLAANQADVGYGMPLTSPAVKSMTLTDNNHEVLQQCRENTSALLGRDNCLDCGNGIRVQKMDWYDDVLPDDVASHNDILISDCVYLFPHVAPLAKTIASLCRGSSTKAHLFGPYNRAAYAEMIRVLREDHGMDLIMDMISMERYRLKPLRREIGGGGGAHASEQHVGNGTLFQSSGTGDARNQMEEERECPYASTNVARFLYVTASFPPDDGSQAATPTDIRDID